MEEIGYEFSSAFNEKYNVVTRKILRALSEDSRISVSDLSKLAGMSRVSVRNRLKKIEQEFGIRYTIELNESALKLVSQHLIVVSFDSKPDYARIREILERSYIPQMAVTVKGNYDLIIYATAISTKDYAHWDKSMQILLAEYGADWRPSEVVHRQLGFFPLRNEIIDATGISSEHKEMLKILNANAKTPFMQISKQLGIHFNTVAYNINKLMKAGYINRFTITMDMPKDVTLMSFFSKYRPKEGYETASAVSRKAFMSDDAYSLVSRYLMCAPLIGSYDFFTLGAFDNAGVAYRHDIQFHKQVMKRHGVKLQYGELDRTIFGRLPIRSMDTRKDYNKIIWDAHLLKK